ncbi:type IV pilus assembly protein FimV [Acinetobacter sp. P1(2025)]|uniref:type IV pilus assembly protein FimV n=1 Tax=Acinetobacter sp. P1(2025) TaxID=3446120 RepID=UPI003F5392C9
MTVYNKLKIAILAIFSSQHLYAITLDPLQVQSAPGELLYAEMSFHQADTNSKLEVSLATPEDLMMIGAAHQPPSGLIFFTRRNSQGEGTIVITSTRPMTEAELNIILKIQEGSASHLKHIRQPIRRSVDPVLAKSIAEKPLTPKFIVSEKDIALNLPVSTRFNANASESKEQSLKQETLLNAPYKLPPVLNNDDSSVNAEAISIAPQPSAQPNTVQQTASANNNVNAEQVAQAPAPSKVVESSQTPQTDLNSEKTIARQDIKKVETTPTQQKVQQPNKTQQTKVKAPEQKKLNSEKTQQHVVQRNESLWSIAQQIASQTQQPVTQVMSQIKKQNEHAFIGGNQNRIRQGSRLNFNLSNIPSRPAQNTNQLAAQTTTAPNARTKYRLQQAEMSLVAESNQDSSTGSAKKDTLQQKTSADLSLKVMTAREKTVTLQRNVTQLELALRQKEQRIQLLNARLAELQEQLKAQQETKKPTR